MARADFRKLHFIFLIKEEDLDSRKAEFEYVKKMGDFFGDWIYQKFGLRYTVESDIMVSQQRSLLQRPDTHLLVMDHQRRDRETYHFYLAFFRPLWTDCTCEGYHAENFAMTWWQRPPDPADMTFLAEKNCPTVSHEIAHEMLRQRNYKRYVADVHDVWTRHYYADLPFVAYGEDHLPTDGAPAFLTMDVSALVQS